MPSKTALLVVDLQRYFVHPEGKAFLADAFSILPRIASLIDAFRKVRAPIIFTRQAHEKNTDAGQMGRWWHGKVIWEGTEDSQLTADVPREESDTVITKTHYSAFEETSLDDELKSQNIETLVICGVMTNLCVETTARHAFMKGYQIVVVEDACASKNKEYHRAAILNLGYGFARIKTTDELLKESCITPGVGRQAIPWGDTRFRSVYHPGGCTSKNDVQPPGRYTG